MSPAHVVLQKSYTRLFLRIAQFGCGYLSGMRICIPRISIWRSEAHHSQGRIVMAFRGLWLAYSAKFLENGKTVQ